MGLEIHEETNRILSELLSEVRSQREVMEQVLEQIESARADAIKRNCPELLKEQMESIGKVMAGTPLASVFEMMKKNMVTGL